MPGDQERVPSTTFVILSGARLGPRDRNAIMGSAESKDLLLLFVLL
jgi:hypothetical protein